MFKKYRESFQSGSRLYRTTAFISFLSPFLMIVGLVASKYEIIGDGINLVLLLSILLSFLSFIVLIINLFNVNSV